MAIPTFELQSRSFQTAVLTNPHEKRKFVWMIATKISAKSVYPTARIGDKVMMPVLTPKPFVPYFRITTTDARQEPFLRLFIETAETDLPLEPILVADSELDSMRDDCVLYEWPYQLYIVQQDIICAYCGMVSIASGFDLDEGHPTCDPIWCLLPEEPDEYGTAQGYGQPAMVGV